MIPYDIDPSLHNTPPREKPLGDGFSPPGGVHPQPSPADGTEPSTVPGEAPIPPVLGEKSAF